MIEHGLTLLFTILVWWGGTGALIVLCGRPARTFGWSFSVITALLLLSGYGLAETAWIGTSRAAYVAFLSAIGVWGWLEASFLMGFITGPSSSPCPANAKGWARFKLALATLLYHELAIILAALAIVALTRGGPNQTGTYAFLILAAMRVSAKLNIFLGVPNLTDEFLPARLSYLKSYFRKARYSALFPVSVTGAGLVALGLAERAWNGEGSAAVGSALLFTLLVLAILEHLFMVLPLRDGALWHWAKPAEKGAS